MTRKVLILNVTRMGDLIQTGPLVSRLRHEWPGAQVDLVVDRQFAAMARLLPGVRATHAFDFGRLMNECRAMSRDVVDLYREVKYWVEPLCAERYDRLVNLTFTRRSGLLASCLNIPDMRGVVCAPDGSTSIRNPWLAYFTDLHRYRRFNRFNLVDLYALGGSGLGPHAPLALEIEPSARQWARECLGGESPEQGWVAVQAGASETIKAWRPGSFGRVMARLGSRSHVGFLMIGTDGERSVVQDAVAAYREAGGTAPIRDLVGRTGLTQLIAVLAQCRLLLTNDTGPMHMAAAVGTPVIDLSVGHVDFHETGPYGSGHWVIQPDLDCAPCGFDRVCLHHACKDRIEVADVAQLCLHVLGQGDLPQMMTGAKLFESIVDEHGLADYRQRAGRVDEVVEWYGHWWRRFWLAEFAGCQAFPGQGPEPAPDHLLQGELLRQLEPIVGALGQAVADLERAVLHTPPSARHLQSAHRRLTDLQQRIADLTECSPALGPLSVALRRELACDEGMSVATMARARGRAFQRWGERVGRVRRAFRSERRSEVAESVMRD